MPRKQSVSVRGQPKHNLQWLCAPVAAWQTCPAHSCSPAVSPTLHSSIGQFLPHLSQPQKPFPFFTLQALPDSLGIWTWKPCQHAPAVATETQLQTHRSVQEGPSYVTWKIVPFTNKTQETLYTGQGRLSPLPSKHLGTSHSSPNPHQLPCCIFLNLINGLPSLPFQRWFQFWEKQEVAGHWIWLYGAESPGRCDVSPKNSSPNMMHEQMCCRDEAAKY